MKNRELAPAKIEDITSQNRNFLHMHDGCAVVIKCWKSPIFYGPRSKPWSLWSQICDPVCTCSTSGRTRSSVLSGETPTFTLAKPRNHFSKSISKTRTAYHFGVKTPKWLWNPNEPYPNVVHQKLVRLLPSCSWKLRWLPSQQKKGSEVAPVSGHANAWWFIAIVKLSFFSENWPQIWWSSIIVPLFENDHEIYPLTDPSLPHIVGHKCVCV